MISFNVINTIVLKSRYANHLCNIEQTYPSCPIRVQVENDSLFTVIHNFLTDLFNDFGFLCRFSELFLYETVLDLKP